METSARNVLVSSFSGLLFAAGWWVFISAWLANVSVLNPDPIPDSDEIPKNYKAVWTISVFTTLGLIMQ